MDIPVLIFDLLFLAVLVMSVGIAVLRGFIREVLTIFGVVGGLFAAYWIGPLLAPVFNGWLVGDAEGDDIPQLFGIIPYDMLADFLAYALIFIIVVIILSFLSHILAGAVRALGLGVFDRILGALFGMVRAVIIVGILYMPFYMMAEKEYREELFGTAKGFTYVERITAQLHGYMPESMTEGSDSDGDSTDNKKRLSTIFGKGVEEKLQELTGGSKETKDAVKPEDKTPPKPPANPSGYEDNQRERLDQLFEEGIDGMNEGKANE